jgi:hypothetical protein
VLARITVDSADRSVYRCLEAFVPSGDFTDYFLAVSIIFSLVIAVISLRERSRTVIDLGQGGQVEELPKHGALSRVGDKIVRILERIDIRIADAPVLEKPQPYRESVVILDGQESVCLKFDRRLL